MLSLTSTHHPHTPGTLQKTSKLSTPRSKHREDHLSSSSSSQVVLFPPPSSSPPRTSLVPAPTAHAVEKKEGGDSSDVLTRSPSSTDPFPSSTDFFSSSSVKHSSESKPELQTSSHPAHAGLPYTRTVSTPRHDVHSTTTSPLLLASSSSLPLPSSKKEDSFPNLSENRGATPSSPSRRVLASPRGRDPSSGSSLTRVQDKNFAMNDEGHATNGDPTSRRKERKEEEEEGEMKETSATASRAGASLPSSSSSSSQQEAPREESFGRPSSASLSPPRRERSRSKTVGGEKAGSLERERGRRHEREDSLVSRGVKKDQEDEDPVVGFFRSVFSKAPAEQKKRRDRSSSVNRPHLHRDYLVSSASRQPENSPLPDGEGRDGISATATISSKPSSSSSTVGQVHRHVDQKEGGKGEREEEEQHGEDSTTNAPSNALVEAAERREAFAFFETREGDTRTISKGASSLSLLSGGVGRRDPKGKKQQDKKEKHHHVKHGSSSASLVRGTPSFVSVNSTLSADRMNSTPVRGVRTPLSRGDGGGGSSSSRILMNRTVLGPASQAASSRSWVSSRQLQNGRRGIGGEEGEEGKASQDTRVRSALFFATEERKKGVIEEEEGRNANGDEEKDEERLTRKERRDELLVHRQSFDLGRERREGGEDEEGVDKKSYELSHERVTRDERGRDPYSSSSAAGGGGGLRSRPVGEALAGKVLPLEATASELAMKRIERRGKNRHLLKKEEEDEERDHPEEEEERDRKNDYKRNSLLHENKEEEKEDGKSDRHRPNSPIVLRALDPEEAEALKKHNSAGGSPLDHHSLEERRRRKEEEGEISREEEEKKRRKNYPNILSEVHGYYQASVSTVTRRRGDHHPTTHTSSTTQGVALYSELSAALATEATTTTTIPGTPNRPRPVARAVLVETSSSSSASGEMTKNSQDSSKPPEDKTDQGRKEEDLKHQPSLVRAKTLVPKARPKRLATLTAGGTSQISSSSSSSVVRVDSPTENLIASTISPLLPSSPSHEG
ncbi:hypothetical protein CSUI_000061 [Cystoisospora suis]|uniref:Uncharacterized protein n=1 Tax=Cystoisospora suis TaxID=483139 RepID=A0A2C6KQ13_9APIC|nr:hypothetical protein CSUI_000061 [Cystoisospora suis]